MRKFIRRTFFFSFVFAFIFFLLFAVFNIASKLQAERYELQPGVHTLAVGDSRMQRAVSDKVLGGTKNVAKESESFIYSYYKLKGILQGNPAIDTVFLGVSYHSFSGYFDEYIYEPEVAARYFGLLPFDKQARLLCNAPDPFRIVMKSIVVGFENLFSGGKYSFVGSYETHETEVTVRSKSVEKRIRKQYYDGDTLRGISQLNKEYYTEIKQLCAEKGVHLILINTPMHAEYARQVPAKFKDAFASITKDEAANTIGFDELDLKDVDFFPDGDHVAATGGVKASNYIKSRLEAGASR